jgi:hypothetical protein
MNEITHLRRYNQALKEDLKKNQLILEATKLKLEDEIASHKNIQSMLESSKQSHEADIKRFMKLINTVTDALVDYDCRGK